MNTKVQSEILEFFKCSRIPFIERTKSSFNYSEFDTNMAMLSPVFYSRQIASVTGAPGAGKSSLIFYSINELDPSEFRVVSTELSNPNKKALYKTIALKLGLKPSFYPEDIKNQIITFFNQENSQGKFNCVIIDECHTLSIPMFDEIRSFYDEGGNFSLILAGLPLLLNHLNLSVNLSLKQRISVFIDCGVLTLSQTKEYINHQLNIAKCKNQIIDEGCFPIVHSLASGSPRKINQFLYAAMCEAYKDRTSIITDEILKKVEVKLAYGQQRL